MTQHAAREGDRQADAIVDAVLASSREDTDRLRDEELDRTPRAGVCCLWVSRSDFDE